MPASRGALEADLAAYKRCAPAVPLVMLSSAAYPALGIEQPAVLDRKAYELLAKTGFKGLTITDAFDTPSIAGHFRPARRALTAGVDLLLYGMNEAGAAAGVRAAARGRRANRLSRKTLRARAERIVAFKQQLAAAAEPDGAPADPARPVATRRRHADRARVPARLHGAGHAHGRRTSSATSAHRPPISALARGAARDAAPEQRGVVRAYNAYFVAPERGIKGSLREDGKVELDGGRHRAAYLSGARDADPGVGRAPATNVSSTP